MEERKGNCSKWRNQIKKNLFEDIAKSAKEHPDEYKKARFEEYPWGK